MKRKSQSKPVGELSERELKRLLRHVYRPSPRGRKALRGRKGVSDGGREWTQGEMQLLGKVRDKEAARLLQRTYVSVRKKRLLLGIRAIPPPHSPWTEEQLKLLGKFTDAEVARRTGFSEKAVFHRRLSLCIPKLDPKCRAWTSSEDALLGLYSDQEVARRTKRPKGGVRARRLLLGIENRFSERVAWTAAERKMLGTAPDDLVADRLGRTKAAVRTHRIRWRIPVNSRFIHRWKRKNWLCWEPCETRTSPNASVFQPAKSRPSGRTKRSFRLFRLTGNGQPPRNACLARCQMRCWQPG